MEPRVYIERARAELKKDNRLGALMILEEGYTKNQDTELLRLLENVRAQLHHLKNMKSYREFYEKKQSKPDRYYKLGRRIERKVRSLLGIRAKRIVKSYSSNPRYLKVEADIRQGNYRAVLDVGCWEGHFSLCLGARNPDISVTGLDIATANIEVANEFNRFKNVKFVLGTAEDINKIFAPSSFDFIMLFEILEHVIDVNVVLDAALDVLEPGGKIAITVPSTEDLDEHHDEHVRFFSDQLILDLFGKRKAFTKQLVQNTQGPAKPNEYSHYITFLKPA